MYLAKDVVSGSLDYKTTKPEVTAPAIIKEYRDKSGVRMYECENKRLFIADTYDRVFVPVRKKIRPQHYREDINAGKK